MTELYSHSLNNHMAAQRLGDTQIKVRSIADWPVTRTNTVSPTTVQWPVYGPHEKVRSVTRLSSNPDKARSVTQLSSSQTIDIKGRLPRI